ncbi:MAG: radical SAM protein [Candidatus Riflebacteria bacterium]|nr:radical SAM protein [Candidatus Riflebacteria bacterium]
MKIFRREPAVKVLGPGKRAVIWVQGCKKNCPGCIAFENRDFSGGQQIELPELRDWLLSLDDIEGITFSGGEPMEQAEEIALLIDSIKSVKDLNILCYTGYTLEELIDLSSESCNRLLKRVDILIDGPYLQNLHADLLWRASSNQRLIALSDMFKKFIEQLNPETDRSAGLEVSIGNDGSLKFSGVPHRPDFRNSFEKGLRERGIILRDAE